jgi:hypothetical protein
VIKRSDYVTKQLADRVVDHSFLLTGVANPVVCTRELRS